MLWEENNLKRLIFTFQTGSLHMTSCLCAKVVNNISPNFNLCDIQT